MRAALYKVHCLIDKGVPGISHTRLYRQLCQVLQQGIMGSESAQGKETQWMGCYVESQDMPSPAS